MAFPKTKIKFNNSDESVAFKAVIKYIFENYTPDKDEEYIYFTSIAHFLDKRLSKETEIKEKLTVNLTEAISLQYYLNRVIFDIKYNNYLELLLTRILHEISSFIDKYCTTSQDNNFQTLIEK